MFILLNILSILLLLSLLLLFVYFHSLIRFWVARPLFIRLWRLRSKECRRSRSNPGGAPKTTAIVNWAYSEKGEKLDLHIQRSWNEYSFWFICARVSQCLCMCLCLMCPRVDVETRVLLFVFPIGALAHLHAISFNGAPAS